MIHFVKAHACGNDFLIIDQDQVRKKDRAAIARFLCARNTGIGADGVEYLHWTGEHQGKISLFNADGSVAEISGNGTRCVAAWMAHKRGAEIGTVMQIETDAGPRVCRILKASAGTFTIESAMGSPRMEERTVILQDGVHQRGTLVDTGNPHFVISVDQPDFLVSSRTWQSIGKEICFHPDFPSQTNVEFVHIRNPGEIEIRIFERGVGPTASSGTGTCATAASSIGLHGCSSPLRVIAPGGEQTVEWQGGQSELLLRGPAILLAEGDAFVEGEDGRS